MQKKRRSIVWLRILANRIHTITNVGLLVVVVIVGINFVFLLGDTSNPEEQLKRMSPEEREYAQEVLGQITSTSTDEEVQALLGEPSRDLGLKKNWWVQFTDRKARVGVNFTSDGYAQEIVLSGEGYYYRRDVPAEK